MSTALLLSFVCLPGIVALVLFDRGRAGRAARAAAPWAALPVLVLSAVPIAYESLELPWLLIGARFELDLVGRVFLIVAALLWTSAGVYARGYVEAEERSRFLFFFLLAMTGNLGLPIAADAVSFYFFFALMTFAAYGIIVHTGDTVARRAGRVYLVLAVIGEVFLLIGLLLTVDAAGGIDLAALPGAAAGSSSLWSIMACLLIGFAIKAGAVPLHVWLPLAHPVAPTPASAVLSGCMIEAGLLGWLRFLPLGEVAQPGWGSFVVAMGVVAAFFGVVVGLLQTDPKTVLAYSSISQMGVMNVGVGIAIAAPEAFLPALAAVTFYAAHHGLAKGALFLAVGVAAARPGWPAGRLVALGVLVPALALAGAPLTSGAVAKDELRGLLPFLGEPWPTLLEWLLPLSAVATTLLMTRFVVLLWRNEDHEPRRRLAPELWAPWGALVVVGVIFLRILPDWYPMGGGGGAEPFDPMLLVLDLLPIVGGLLLYRSAVLGWRRVGDGRRAPSILPGDILGPIERLLRRARRPERLLEGVALVPGIATEWYRLYSESDRSDRLIRMELVLTRWASGASILLLLCALIFLLLLRGG